MLTAIELLRHLAVLTRQPADALAIDVGAHVGAFAAELLDSGLYGGVVAFEPNPANLAMLDALATARPALTVVKKGVGAAEGVANLHCDDDTATGSLLAYDADYATKGSRRSMGVPVVTLDTYLDQFVPAPIALIKIDTQGHDLAVLQGAARTLARHRPVVIAEMIYVPLYEGQSTPQTLCEWIRQQGYETYTLFNIHVTVEGRMAFADALFVPSELRLPFTQRFEQIDNHVSYQTQIATLDRICAERLAVINLLDAEVKRLKADGHA